jgi:hypothetical protein
MPCGGHPADDDSIVGKPKQFDQPDFPRDLGYAKSAAPNRF